MIEAQAQALTLALAFRKLEKLSPVGASVCITFMHHFRLDPRDNENNYQLSQKTTLSKCRKPKASTIPLVCKYLIGVTLRNQIGRKLTYLRYQGNILL